MLNILINELILEEELNHLSKGRDKMTNNNDYLEHEIKIRVMKEVNEVRFREIEELVKTIDSKINWLIGFFLTSIVVPAAFHFMNLI